MDITEVEESLFAASDAKLHGELCKALSAIYCKITSIFPSLEAARPRSKSGIQALCSLHVALEKAKNVLQHCSECSKLYLAITGDSVLSKFEKARCALMDSLRRVEDIVPQSIGCQIEEIVSELEGTVLSLDPLEKKVGDEIIALLQQGKKFDNCNDNNELESFHQAAIKLGITSSRAALTERRALKKVIQRARAEEDKRKESIVAYLLHLMRKYSKLFRSEISDDNDSQGSAPCSPTIQGSIEDAGPGGNVQAFDRQLSKLSSFNFKSSFNSKPYNRKSGQMPLPPEELRCPISLQLMYDPVIIASGQTYERICIEKWFGDGHNTCPKTQQKLSHLFLTPNYCVKGLIASWCEQNGICVPDGPPESLDLNYWRLAFESESTDSKSMGNVGSCKVKGVKVVPLEESHTIKEDVGNETEDVSPLEEESELDVFESYQDLLTTLNEEEDFRKRCEVVEQIRLLLKEDEEARMYMGANGFVEALLHFLSSALREAGCLAQESGAMALFNLAVNNNSLGEEMDFLSCILLGLMVAWISIHTLYYSLGRRSLDTTRLPPGPNPLPFIGNLLELGNKPHLSLTKLSQRYGPIMTLHLGQITTVVISSSTVAKEVLRTHDQLFCNRTVPDALQACQHSTYSMAWIPVSATWKNLRKTCNSQLFTTKILDANQANRHLKVQELISDVNESAVKGEVVDIGRAAFKTSLNLLSRTIFSVDLVDPHSARAREFKELVWSILEESLKPNLADYFPVLKRIDPQGIRRRQTGYYRKMFDIFDRLMMQRFESRKELDYAMTNDMLDTLINLSEKKNEDMDMDETQHLFLDLFAAATDTTSSTLEWAMAELLRNPEKLFKAQAELKQTIGKGKLVEESDIGQLPYLQAIIKETFRLYPAAPLLIPRKAEIDVEICGYVVPKGAQVFVNAWAIGRDPGIWDNPDSFVPERFLGSEIDFTGKNFELIPFGGGRRMCPGMPLAVRMVNLMLGSLINCFSNWKLEDGVTLETMNMDQKFGLTLQKAQPLKAVPML